MFGLKDNSIIMVGVFCKGEGLYNFYCFGCVLNFFFEVSMLFYDWVSDIMKEFVKKIYVMLGSYEF